LERRALARRERDRRAEARRSTFIRGTGEFIRFVIVDFAMRNLLLRLLAAALLVLLAMPAAYATCGGGGGGGMGGAMPGGFGSMAPRAYVVPWKTLNAAEGALNAPYVVYWFPSTPDEMDRGDMNSSRLLTLYSAQCVGMQVVKPGDAETLAKWELTGKQPAALLVQDGKAVDHVDAEKGRLNTRRVEDMVQKALGGVEKSLETQLADARKQATAGDKDGAVAAFQKVWEQRCLAPKQGRAAQKELRRLGVEVKDAQLRESDPVMTAEMNARMTAAMNEALRAEVASKYAKARALYRAAAAIDPADPVPPRFLGELYRHHTGEWTLARETFERLLTMQPDPLGRAVALHGLGKMTIHMGDSAKGLALFEQSIAAYPLALTYRNMAVYWNSERERAKADAYVRKALALDPKDSYNLIFAATYLADSDRKAEALKIAKDNEHVLSASYNLAAIHALLGNKGKAMELLRRHFYQYERYDDVRAMEMWEARVDYVFSSIKDDPEFVKLTAMAR
jgi:tetratricopeptide (TPR) repeat protein